jgi:hypothetical protein
MAKRKRLSPAGPLDSDHVGRAPETKSTFPPGLGGRPPIAQVAGEAASLAALEELSGEMARARAEGRIIQALPLASVDETYLVRDRMLADEEELAVLMESLKARGQQSPIEVVELGQGRYGLISGWRRLTALRRLAGAEGQGGEPRTVLAVLRRPETASDAYLSMVEENEIRVGLSFYERARIVARAAEEKVYPDARAALSGLFASASRSKRSKIGSFLRLYEALDDRLSFASAIPERLGLALVKALEDDSGFRDRLRDRLRKTPAGTPSEEIAALERAVKGQGEKPTLKASLDTKLTPEPTAYRSQEVAPGITLQPRGDTLVLSGAGVTDGFRAELEAWLRRR